MRKFCIVLALLLYAVNLFALPDNWHTLADTAWVTSSSDMALTIVVGNSIDMATAKKIAMSKAGHLAVELLGNKIADTLTSATGETITKMRSYGNTTSRIMDEKLFQEKDGTYSYYLIMIVIVAEAKKKQ